MAIVTFFYADSIGELVNACIELALIYKCDPFVFLERSENEVMELYRLTSERLRHVQQEG